MLIDSHCHLDFPKLAEQEAAVCDRASAAGVAHMLTVSTKVRQFDRIRAIAEANHNVYCSVGTHPHYAEDEADITVSELVGHSRHNKVIAFGEAGLDYYYENSPREAQRAGFRRHIAAARETWLPLIIHTRDAEEDTVKTIEEELEKGDFRALLHCFTGSAWLAEKALAAGLYISFSGVLTFKNADKLRAVAADVPLDRILVETDAPFLAPEPYRGKTNEPAYVVETARCLAEIKGITLAEIAKASTDNFFSLFRKARQ
jgi:TatD DNase family protein